MRRIHNSSLLDQKKFLLGECIEAYLPMDDDQRLQLEGILDTATYREVKAMNLTSYDKGTINGRWQALLEVLKEEIEMKFESEGSLWFEQLPKDIELSRINELRRAVRTAEKISDL